MDVFDLQAKITLDSSGFESALARSASGIEGLGTKIGILSQAIYDLGKKAAEIFFDVAESVVKVGAGFDTAMANVAAISGASGDSLDALREKAKEMGATTKFSASEAADAFGYMAMAGWKTEDMLAGIDGIMNLAAASGEDLATTSDIVTDALTAFGLTAEDAGRFADILAAASSNANTNVSMMGETFKYVAPLAGTLGYSAEDVAVAVGLMANSGIKAGQAGTSLRAALSSMLNPSEKAADLMEDLGISMTDVNGNSLPLADTFDMLREAFSGLAESEQASAAAVLFGQEAMSGMLSVINAAPADIEKLTEAVANAEGAAANMSAVMQDNVGGAWDEFTSALEGAQIALYDTFSDDLQDKILGAADGVSRLTAAFEQGGTSGAMNEAVTMLSEMTGLDLSGVTETFAGIGEAITTIGEGFAEGGVGGGFEAITAQIETLTGLDLSGVTETFAGIGEAITTIGEGFAEGGVGGGFEAIVGQIESLTGLDLTGVTESFSGIGEAFAEVGTAFAEGGVEGGITAVIGAFKDLTGIDLSGIVEGVKRFVDAFTGTDSAVFESVGEAISALLAAFDSADLAAVISAVAYGIGEFLGTVGKVSSDVIAFLAQVIAELARNFEQLLPGVVGIVAAIGSFIVVVKGMSIISSIPTLLAAASTAIHGFSAVFGALNAVMAANPIALVVGLLAGLATAFATAMATSEEFREAVVGAIEAVADAAQKAWDAVSGFFGGIWGKITGFLGFGEEAGDDLAAGLEAGISSGISGREGRVKKSAGEITKYFNDTYDRHSPSKVFAEMGRDLMRGLEVGISDEAGGVQRTIDGLRFKAPTIQTGRIDVKDSTMGRLSTASINNAIGLASGSGGNGQPAVVNLVVDGRTLAQVMFDPLNNIIRQKGVTLGAQN